MTRSLPGDFRSLPAGWDDWHASTAAHRAAPAAPPDATGEMSGVTAASVASSPCNPCSAAGPSALSTDVHWVRRIACAAYTWLYGRMCSGVAVTPWHLHDSALEQRTTIVIREFYVCISGEKICQVLHFICILPIIIFFWSIALCIVLMSAVAQAHVLSLLMQRMQHVRLKVPTVSDK